jgi:hypothetical protein
MKNTRNTLANLLATALILTPIPITTNYANNIARFINFSGWFNKPMLNSIINTSGQCYTDMTPNPRGTACVADKNLSSGGCFLANNATLNNWPTVQPYDGSGGNDALSAYNACPDGTENFTLTALILCGVALTGYTLFEHTYYHEKSARHIHNEPQKFYARFLIPGLQNLPYFASCSL